MIMIIIVIIIVIQLLLKYMITLYCISMLVYYYYYYYYWYYHDYPRPLVQYALEDLRHQGASTFNHKSNSYKLQTHKYSLWPTAVARFECWLYLS